MPDTRRFPLTRAFAALALCLAQLSCRSPEAPPSPLPSTLRIAVHSDPLSLDPHLQNEMLSFALLCNVVETLTAFDPAHRVEPALARSWENPDELTWRFNLRPGVVFHDGSTLDAADVVGSLERARSHPRSNLTPYLVDVTEITSPDPLTVELRTARPVRLLLNKLAYVGILPAGTGLEIERPIGTGAYCFADYELGKRLRLEAFDRYWNGPPEVSEVVFMPIAETERRVEMLLAGEIDLVREVDPADTGRITASPQARVEGVLGLLVAYLHLQPHRPPFDDPRVREAIDLALDRPRLVSEVLAGQGEAVGQMVSPNAFGFDPAIAVPERDVERARELLSAAGYPDGLDLDLEARTGRRGGEQIATQLAEAGIRVRLVVRPWREMFDRLLAGEVDFYFGGVLAPGGDASDFFDGFAHTVDPARAYGASNFPRYSSPTLDDLAEQAGRMPGMLERRDLLQRAMRVLMADRVYVPLWVARDVYGVRTDLEWRPRLDTFLLAREMRFRALE